MKEQQLRANKADLAKAKTEGRLIVLPCQVGDTVYWLENRKVKKAVACQFGYEDHLWVIAKIGKGKKLVVLDEARLFFTQEEAESSAVAGGKVLDGALDGGG